MTSLATQPALATLAQAVTRSRGRDGERLALDGDTGIDAAWAARARRYDAAGPSAHRSMIVARLERRRLDSCALALLVDCDVLLEAGHQLVGAYEVARHVTMVRELELERQRWCVLLEPHAAGGGQVASLLQAPPRARVHGTHTRKARRQWGKGRERGIKHGEEKKQPSR